jgi:subtilisin family serine protease
LGLWNNLCFDFRQMRLLSCTLLLLLLSACAVEDANERDLDAVDAADEEQTKRTGKFLEGLLRQRQRVRVDITFDSELLLQPQSEASRNFVKDKKIELLQAMGNEFSEERAYKNVPVLTGSITRRGVELALQDADVVFIEWDGDPTSGQLLEAQPLVGLSQVRDQVGLQGNNIRVALIDSGIDANHPDLKHALAHESCFCSGDGGCCPSGEMQQTGPGAAQDGHGHGTHIAGIVASLGNESPQGGAPGVELHAIKVLSDSLQSCCASDLIGALDSLIENGVPKVDLVNMSVASDSVYSGHCDKELPAYAAAVNHLTRSGVAIIAATGNTGVIDQLPAPACLDNVISVGAIYDADLGPIAAHTCTDAETGPDQIPCWVTRSEDLDILAPGGQIESTKLGGGSTGKLGTSMAAPMVTACAATLLEQDPSLEPDELLTLLAESPVRIGDDSTRMTFPRLDCASSIEKLRTR